VDIGLKIKTARQAKGMTQEELGEILGLQKSAIAKYESGRVVNIKRSTLKKISDVLDIPPFELVFDEEIKRAPAEMAERHFEMIIDEDLNDIFADFKILDEAQKKIVKDLIRSLAATKKEV
jgi:transcriptional regulator with XRE-family HTH domain